MAPAQLTGDNSPHIEQQISAKASRLREIAARLLVANIHRDALRRAALLAEAATLKAEITVLEQSGGAVRPVSLIH